MFRVGSIPWPSPDGDGSAFWFGARLLVLRRPRPSVLGALQELRALRLGGSWKCESILKAPLCISKIRKRGFTNYSRVNDTS